jgi:hypothetical protein
MIMNLSVKKKNENEQSWEKMEDVLFWVLTKVVVMC